MLDAEARSSTQGSIRLATIDDRELRYHPTPTPGWDPIHGAAAGAPEAEGAIEIEKLAKKDVGCLINARVRNEHLEYHDDRAHTFTPVMLVAYAGQDKVLGKLLELGANPHLHVKRHQE